MSVTAEKTVRELAMENFAATRVFEKLGIDYCCGGSQSIEQACRAANVRVDEVMKSIEAAGRSMPTSLEDRRWQCEPLADLIVYIQNRHHKYTREEIARLNPLFDKVCSVHGMNHPELPKMLEIFHGLAGELTMHMMKEEMVLFPYVIRLENAGTRNEPVPFAPFGTVKNPVAMMVHEHDSAGEALRALRQASRSYAPPQDACLSFKTLFNALSEFEADLHQHIHLENNILFPRAIELEKRQA
ncbi:MAG TPA: iron-sulfur cluster repair di-iron protein [Terriglobia bacterium]|nr:iron-sulfur cluster repair di-iron protein [Terriglobia bacterium]